MELAAWSFIAQVASDVSSSLIKQITPLASDEELARFIPREIIPDLRAKLTE